MVLPEGIEFRGQLLQDRWVYHQLSRMKSSMNEGYFVDIGCNDGVMINNTLVFEQLGWNGFCVDADVRAYEKACRSRVSPVDYGAVWSESGQPLMFQQHEESLLSSIGETGKEVISVSLNDLLSRYNAPEVIDYISLDVEGAECDVLSGFDDEGYTVKCWTIEHNGDSERISYLVRWLMDRNYLIKFVAWDLFAVLDTHPMVVKG